jgi:ABC-2 type transport system permease protein
VNILFVALGINGSSTGNPMAGGTGRLSQTSVVKIESGSGSKENDRQSLKTSEKTTAILQKLPTIVGWFLLFFVGGFLLYGSMFAAIGSAVDQDSGETQQFMLPVTVPLIISIAVSATIINNPQSPMAFWMSMIPFTSPIIMMMRIPFGVPVWQILLSVGILFATFAVMLYFSAKIYRIGIISYGKRFTFKDLWTWMRQA